MSSASVNNNMAARGASARGGALQATTTASALGSLFGADDAASLASFADQLARAGTPGDAAAPGNPATRGIGAAKARSAAPGAALANTPAAGASSETPTGALAQWVAEWLSGKGSNAAGADGASAMPLRAMSNGDDASTTLEPGSAELLAAGLPAASNAAACGGPIAASLGPAALTAARGTAEAGNDAMLTAAVTIDASSIGPSMPAASEAAASGTTPLLDAAEQSLRPNVDGSLDTAPGTGMSDDTPPDGTGSDTSVTPQDDHPPQTTSIATVRGHATPAAISAPGAEHRSATANAVLQARFGAEAGSWPGHATPPSAAPHGAHPGGRSGEADALGEADDLSNAGDKAKASRRLRTTDDSTAPNPADAESTSKSKRKNAGDELDQPTPSAPPLALVQPLPAVTPEALARSTSSASTVADREDPFGSVPSGAERSSAAALPGIGGDGTWQNERESPALASNVAPAAGGAMSMPPGAPSAADRSDRWNDDAPRTAPGVHASYTSTTVADAASLAGSLNSSATQADAISADARPSEPLPTFAMPPMPQPGAPSSAQSTAEVPFATPFGAPEFQADFGAQVSLLARDGVEEAELRLNPVEMGPVSVRISIDGDRAQIDFGADSPATRALIEAGMPELASALREAGLTLAGGGVGEHARGQSEGRPAGGDASSHDRPRGGHPGGPGSRSAGDSQAPAQPARRTVSGNGRLDLYA